MTRYFDFSPVESWAGGYGAVGDALSGVADTMLKRRRLDSEEARQRAAQAFMEKQAAQAQAAQASRERREDLEFRQRQARQQGLDVQAIGKVYNAGGLGQAQALGAASQFVNPKTGQLEGIGVAQKPLGPEPQAPTMAPQDLGTIARGIGGALGFGTGRPEDLQGVGANVQAAKDKYAADTKAYEQEKKNPILTLTVGGRATDINTGETRAAEAQKARDTAAQYRTAASQPGTPPDVQRALLLQADLIESQASNADKAPITNRDSAVQSQGFKAGESALDRQVDRERIASSERARRIGKGVGAGANAGIAELIKMKEDGATDSAIAARAVELRIPAGGKSGWLQNTKEVTRGAAAAGRAAEQKSALAVYDPKSGAYLGDAPDNTRARHTAQELTQLNDVRGNITALKDHIAKEGTVAPFGLTSAGRSRESLATNLVTTLSAFKKLGAISEGDKVMIDKMISGGAPHVLGLNADQLDGLLAAVDRGQQNVLRSQGIAAEQGAATQAPQAAPKGPAPVPVKPPGNPAPKGKRVRLRDGREGTITPDGLFHEGA